MKKNHIAENYMYTYMKCFQVRETYFASTSYNRDSNIGKMFKIQNRSFIQFNIYYNIWFNHTWPNIIHV